MYTCDNIVIAPRSLPPLLPLSLSPPPLSGRSLVLEVGLTPLVVEATAILLPQGAKVTPAAQATVHHLDEDTGAPTPDPIPVPDQDLIPVPDGTGGTLDQGAVPTLPTPGRSMAGAETEADLQCRIGEGTRETE